MKMKAPLRSLLLVLLVILTGCSASRPAPKTPPTRLSVDPPLPHVQPPAANPTPRHQIVPASTVKGCAAAVASFADALRDGKHLAGFDYASIARLANGARGEDARGYRDVFVQLVRLAGGAAAPGQAPPGIAAR